MASVNVGLTLYPPSVPQNAATFEASVAWNYGSGPQPTGNVSILVDGANVATAGVAPPIQQIPITLSAPSAGAHSVSVEYAGDLNYGIASALQTLTVTSGGVVAAATAAKAQAACTIVAGAALTRADRENGSFAAEAYKVTAITMQSPGGNQYDSNTVAILYGKVGGVATRQNLTVALTGSGGIQSLTGFDGSTVWDSPPSVTITRWSGAGDSATFLGY